MAVCVAIILNKNNLKSKDCFSFLEKQLCFCESRKAEVAAQMAVCAAIILNKNNLKSKDCFSFLEKLLCFL